MRKKIVSFLVLLAVGLALPLQSLLAKSVSQKEKSIKTLLLLALPASGKSELRRYLSNLSPEASKEKYGIAKTVQIDDFPFVHVMRVVSDEMVKRGYEGAFFLSPALSFKTPFEWGTLMHLINEDYADIVQKNIPTPKFAAPWLFRRIDNARRKEGLPPVFSRMNKKLYKQVAKVLEKDAQKILDNKVKEIKAFDESKTIVIEFARGGADSSPMPLPAPYGYRYAFSKLIPDVLNHASILYIWVSPEEARKKNEARADPKDPGSILNHAVPRAVMYSEYGCDDIDWMMKNSEKSNTVCVAAHGRLYYLPIARFDNRKDQTTFLRQEVDQWDANQISALEENLVEAFGHLSSRVK